MGAQIGGSFFDHAYFEDGVVSGKSGYTNYQWLPDLTLPMAHHIIRQLDIPDNAKVLDYGCAKGYLVRALRLLGIEAYGVDISEYALSHCHESVKTFCGETTGPLLTGRDVRYDYVLAKDVFEHIQENDLELLVRSLSEKTRNIFIAIPLAKNGSASEFVIPAYHMDQSHITIRDKEWWESLIDREFEIISSSYVFRGCKENWTSAYPEGNLFVTASSRRVE